MKVKTVHIIGAGPSGLSAAITLARAGIRTIVFEQAEDVGARFSGDFQGLENWSSDDDVITFLHKLGVEINFRCVPVSSGIFYGPDFVDYQISSDQPWFYLIERGSGSESLDQGLKQQALLAGAEIRFGETADGSEGDFVIVATGPRAADATARGLVFETSHPDACVGLLDDRLAPRAYAYLLISGGRGTLATCLYDNFQDAHIYFENTLRTFKRIIDFDMNSPKTFGGYINFSIPSSWTRNNRLLFVGERGGFQDALWGFGLRYALWSGHLAAKAIITDESYDELCRQHILPLMETSLANRLLFSQLGNHGYSWVLGRMDAGDVLSTLREHHRPSKSKRLIYEIAKRRIHPHLREYACKDEACACLWCRHGKIVDHRSMADCVKYVGNHP